MGLKDVLKDLAQYFTGEALIGAAEHLRDTVDETVERVIKASILFVIFVIGMVFVLVGIAHYLQANWGWVDGLGLIVVGAALVLLGFFAKAVR